MRKTRYFLPLTWAVVLSMTLLLFTAAKTAFAHAKVIESNPKAGSTVTAAPTTITVQTAENMNPDPKKSNLFVYGPAGDLISQGNATILLNNPKQMSITIKPTGNGVYVVRWLTVSADDGDPDEGAFVFTVNPNGASASAATSSATPTTKSTTAPAATASTNAASPVLPAVITGVVALVFGLGLGLGFGRSRTAPGAANAPTPEKEEVRHP